MCICRLVARVMKILGIWPWFRVWPQKNFEDLHIKWYKNLRCGEEIQEQLDTTRSRPLHGSAPRGHWTLQGPGPSMGQPPGVTGHYWVQAPPWVSPRGSLDTTGVRPLLGSAPRGGQAPCAHNILSCAVSGRCIITFSG